MSNKNIEIKLVKLCKPCHKKYFFEVYFVMPWTLQRNKSLVGSFLEIVNMKHAFFIVISKLDSYIGNPNPKDEHLLARIA